MCITFTHGPGAFQTAASALGLRAQAWFPLSPSALPDVSPVGFQRQMS